VRENIENENNRIKDKQRTVKRVAVETDEIKNNTGSRKQKIMKTFIENINLDAKAYGKMLKSLTRFEICGICGIEDSVSKMVSKAGKESILNTEHELKNAYDKLLLECDKMTELYDKMIENDTKMKHEITIEKDITVESDTVITYVSMAEYKKDVADTFDEYGILKHTEFVCKYCFGKLSKMNRAKKKNDDDDDDDDDILKNQMSCSNDVGKDIGDGKDEHELNDVDSDDGDSDDDDDDDDGDDGNDELIGKTECDDKNKNGRYKDSKYCNNYALINGMFCGTIPDELKGLTTTEISLISQINVVRKFISDIAADGNGYSKSYKKVYTLINNLTKIAQQLPNMESLNSIAYLKTANTDVKKSYKYRPNRVKKALVWLKKNNPFYKDVELTYPDDWAAIIEKDVDIEIAIDSCNMTSEFETEVRDAVNHLEDKERCDEETDDVVEGMETEFIFNDDSKIISPDEVFKSAGECTNFLIREKYRPDLLIRKYNTADFIYLAFPTLYPYGKGYKAELNDMNYCKKIFRHGFDRRFQSSDDFIFFYYYEILSKKISWIATIAESNKKHNDDDANNDIIENINGTSSNGENDDMNLNAVNVMKFFDTVNNGSNNVLSKLQIEKFAKMLSPYSSTVPGTPMHITLMRRRMLSMVSNPIVLEDGVFTWFNTVTPADFYCPLLFTVLMKTEGRSCAKVNPLETQRVISWEEAEEKVKKLTQHQRKQLLRQNPALFCRLFELKQKIIDECILNGLDVPLGAKISDYVKRCEFQGRGCPHYHILYAIIRGVIDETDIFSDNPVLVEKVKRFVDDKITAILLERNDDDDDDHQNYTHDKTAEKDFLYHPTSSELGQQFDCSVEDPRTLFFDSSLDYTRIDGKYRDKEVRKRYRNMQVASFIHHCMYSCWKYNRRSDYTCRFNYPYSEPIKDVEIVTTHNKRNNKPRTRVLPKRNNANLQPTVTSALYTLAQSSNFDQQFIADSRGAAEYTGSYSLKTEQPDSKLMQQILQRMLRSKTENDTVPLNLRDCLKYVGESIVSATRVGTAQAAWFLTGLEFVQCSREFLHINTLPRNTLKTSIITSKKKLSEMLPTDSVIREPGVKSQLGE
jgi:hypothetical protein